MVKEDIKKKWLAALRSGEYVQGQSLLKTPDGNYCCLGVLCDLARKAGVVKVKNVTTDYGDEVAPMVITDTYFISATDPNDKSDIDLPGAVQDWAGLDSSNPRVIDTNSSYESKNELLSSLNDSGRTFEEIADLIEDQL
jgi:hypothetical protein